MITEALITVGAAGVVAIIGMKLAAFRNRIKDGKHLAEFCRKHGHLKKASDQYWVKGQKRFRQCQRCDKFYKVK